MIREVVRRALEPSGFTILSVEGVGAAKLALAEREPLIQAVVGWADLTSPAIGDVLDGLLAGPGGSYLRSLRHLKARTEAELARKGLTDR